MDMQEKINLAKSNIRQAIKDYGAHSYQTAVLTNIDARFVEKLAEDNTYAKAELRTLFRESPVWDETLDALVINGTRTHNPDYDIIAQLGDALLKPAYEKADFEVHEKLGRVMQFFIGSQEDKASGIAAIQELAPHAYAPNKKPSRVFKALCQGLGIADESAGSTFQRLYAQFADELSGRKDGKGLSSSTVRAVRRYFCMCLDDAVEVGLIPRNVVRSTKPTKLIKKDIVVLTKEELNRLLAIAREIRHPYMRVMMPELIRFTAHTGLRQGEVFGLLWQDVDFEHGAIFVQHSLAHVVGKGAVLQAPKTKNSRRRVLLLPEDVESLRKYHDWQQSYAEELGDQYARRDLVFASTFGSPISPTNFLRRHFHPLLEKCGIKDGFTFHGLRHTHATLLLKQGVNPKIVQERLGHSSIKVTMDTYSHVLPDMQQQAVDALSKILT